MDASNEPAPDNATLQEYDASRFALRARRAARILAWAHLAPVALFLYAVATGAAGYLLVAAALAAIAWGVGRRRLWAVVALTLEVALGILIPLSVISTAFGDGPLGSGLTRGVWIALGTLAVALAALPLTVVLLRDQERQYALGRWT